MLFYKIKRKIFKSLMMYFPFNGIRVLSCKLAHYQVGENVYIGEHTIIVDRLSDRKNLVIGDRVSIAPGCIFITSSSPNSTITPTLIKEKHGNIIIEDDVWIGAGCILMPNINVGKCSIVGAGAVVTKNVEPYSIVAGVPAFKIGEVETNENSN